MIDTYPEGMVVVVEALFAILIAVSLLELLCEIKHWPSISHQVENWADQNPWYAGALLALLLIFIAHFVLNPLPKTSLDVLPFLPT